MLTDVIHQKISIIYAKTLPLNLIRETQNIELYKKLSWTLEKC